MSYSTVQNERKCPFHGGGISTGSFMQIAAGLNDVQAPEPSVENPLADKRLRCSGLRYYRQFIDKIYDLYEQAFAGIHSKE